MKHARKPTYEDACDSPFLLLLLPISSFFLLDRRESVPKIGFPLLHRPKRSLMAYFFFSVARKFLRRWFGRLGCEVEVHLPSALFWLRPASHHFDVKDVEKWVEGYSNRHPDCPHRRECQPVGSVAFAGSWGGGRLGWA